MRVCTLMSGSWGNAIFVGTKKTQILIDAGQSGKCLTRALEESCGHNPAQLAGILITHAHRDHVMGAGVLSRRYKLPLYATEGTWQEMEPLIGEIQPGLQRCLNTNWGLEIGDLEIESFPTSHDALESVGFVVSCGEKSLGVATDSGVFTTRMARTLKDADCLILEANHDPQMLLQGSYPWSLKKRISGNLGHLSNPGAGEALLKVLGGKTKRVILAHLSQENNKPHLAMECVGKAIRDEGVDLEELEITVAPRYTPGPLVRL